MKLLIAGGLSLSQPKEGNSLECQYGSLHCPVPDTESSSVCCWDIGPMFIFHLLGLELAGFSPFSPSCCPLPPRLWVGLSVHCCELHSISSPSSPSSSWPSGPSSTAAWWPQERLLAALSRAAASNASFLLPSPGRNSVSWQTRLACLSFSLTSPDPSTLTPSCWDFSVSLNLIGWFSPHCTHQSKQSWSVSSRWSSCLCRNIDSILAYLSGYFTFLRDPVPAPKLGPGFEFHWLLVTVDFSCSIENPSNYCNLSENSYHTWVPGSLPLPSSRVRFSPGMYLMIGSSYYSDIIL